MHIDWLNENQINMVLSIKQRTEQYHFTERSTSIRIVIHVCKQEHVLKKVPTLLTIDKIFSLIKIRY